VSDCPLDCGWRYDPMAAPVVARQVGQGMPVLWDGKALRRALGSDPVHGRFLSTGKHICEEHPQEPAVLLLGPVRFELI
jgi:hypothetical protein